MKNPDLEVPAGQRARYEAAFAKFSSIFPDTFYVRERGRFYPDDTEDKGRLLSAGFHNVMGYFARRRAAQRAAPGRKGTEGAGGAVGRVRVRRRLHGAHVHRVLLQPERRGAGQRPRVRQPSARRQGDHRGIGHSRFQEGVLAKAAADATNSPIAFEAITDHFDRVNAAIRGVERKRLEAEPRQLDALLAFAARAYRRPLTAAERDDLRGVLPFAARARAA